MRLFAALDLSAEARTAIAAEQRRIVSDIGEAGARLRLVKPDLMHITLAFIGEVEEGRAPSVVEAMGATIDQAPFAVAFAGVSVFPPHGRPRALFLGIARGAAETTELQRRVASILESVGIPPEPRPFYPHLTLARWRDGRPRDRWLGPAGGRTATVATMDVVEVGLYQSRLSSQGPAYTRLARALLA